MLDVLSSKEYNEIFGIDGNCLIKISAAKMMNANVYIWAESDIHAFVRLFKGYGLRISKVISISNKYLKYVDDVEIITPDELLNDETSNIFYFLNATDYYDVNNVAPKMIEYIKRTKLAGFLFLSLEDRSIFTANTVPTFDANRIIYYQSHKHEIMNFFNLLEDYKSKQTLYDYVSSYVSNSVYKGEQIPTQYKYFFGSKNELLYNHLDDECWIN